MRSGERVMDLFVCVQEDFDYDESDYPYKSYFPKLVGGISVVSLLPFLLLSLLCPSSSSSLH